MIIQITVKFKLNQESLYLTVNIIDRYLTLIQMEKQKFQLLGIAAILIASKFEEIYAPELRDFVYICDNSFTRSEILGMEYQILKTLDFNILTVYPYTFLSRYHFASGDSKKSLFYSQYILETSLLEYRMLKYKSSIKAAASMYISRKILKHEPYWGKDLQIASNYSEKDLIQCATDMCNVLDIIPKTNLRACFNKYSSEKFMCVSKIF
jgi:hypothetical protein